MLQRIVVLSLFSLVGVDLKYRGDIMLTFFPKEIQIVCIMHKKVEEQMQIENLSEIQTSFLTTTLEQHK